jgi:hypothetical protein
MFLLLPLKLTPILVEILPDFLTIELVDVSSLILGLVLVEVLPDFLTI